MLEVAILDVVKGQASAFEDAFKHAQSIISSMDGYISHRLRRCVAVPERYLLTVQWQSLEAHTEGFRESSEYQAWRALLHHFYTPLPTVEHYHAEDVFV
ncbi:antibiotic biosynthesis monooxygenase family protein [Arenicella chitinivorans]|uniref:antibiotic biosynthesis monooxygenase family protein n=1 Tax=Arenicella chitinivorans TaxID=1329800 RepID=UPI003570A027